MLNAVKKFFGKNELKIPAKSSEDAYNLWSVNYDSQPHNLMLALDEIIFSELLSETDISNRMIADIGCGTGRHWKKILEKTPLALTGFDVSEGMLSKLKIKFPGAAVKKITDNFFINEPVNYYDAVVSTLTLAHIENITEAINAWSRILKSGGDMLITDFHPRLLAHGGKRTFSVNRQQFAVKNFVHEVDDVINILGDAGFSIVKKIERRIDDTVKHYYMEQNALHIFERYKGEPVIYGLHAKKNDT